MLWQGLKYYDKMGDGMLSLSWNNHKATFCHILSTLREKERYTDVTLACEGKFYPVHKLVLSTCSEYFEKMFEHTPCKHPVIVLKDVKPVDLEALLSYMYAGVVSVAQNDLARLIKAAELLQIKGLAVPDEPPTRMESRKYIPRDERISPHPKRRRREETSIPIAPSVASVAPSSPPSSPPPEPEQTWDQPAIHMEEPSNDNCEVRLNNNAEQQDEMTLKAKHEQMMVNQDDVDETLVKEEMVEMVEDSQGEGPHDSSVEYSGGGDGSTDDHQLKYSHDPKHPPLPEAVVEALAGPSGAHGWLGMGEIGGGFSILEGYGEDGSQDHAGIGNAQAHQMGDGTRNGGRGAVIKGNQCPYCSHTTVRKDHMSKHIRTHTGEKPFDCPHCPYRSSTKYALNKHIRVHTGEKPYPCSICPYRASQRSALHQHMQKHSQATI